MPNFPLGLFHFERHFHQVCSVEGVVALKVGHQGSNGGHFRLIQEQMGHWRDVREEDDWLGAQIQMGQGYNWERGSRGCQWSNQKLTKFKPPKYEGGK